MCIRDRIYTNDKIHERGLKSVLWGCSIGKANLTPEKIATLKRFSLIYARESLTAIMLKQELKLNNVVTFPDPAFLLEPEEVDLPDCFNQGSVIGLNISNYVLGGFDFESRLGKDIVQFVETIISSTNKDVYKRQDKYRFRQTLSLADIGYVQRRDNIIQYLPEPKSGTDIRYVG